MNSNKHLVFVYGTLKTGYGNHRVLRKSPKVMSAMTQDDYVMLDLGSFPGVVKRMQGYDSAPIEGEVYRVDDKVMEDLDVLEANGMLYQREEVFLKDFERPVWMYIYLNGWGSGDFMEVINNRYIW